VVLPPPSSGHAEFVILRSRFEASLQTTWQPGDRVQVCISKGNGALLWGVGCFSYSTV
jgi:hypothetical protein